MLILLVFPMNSSFMYCCLNVSAFMTLLVHDLWIYQGSFWGLIVFFLYSHWAGLFCMRLQVTQLQLLLSRWKSNLVYYIFINFSKELYFCKGATANWWLLTQKFNMQVTHGKTGSPVDMAKSYMEGQPTWSSPASKHVEFSTLSPMQNSEEFFHSPVTPVQLSEVDSSSFFLFLGLHRLLTFSFWLTSIPIPFG